MDSIEYMQELATKIKEMLDNDDTVVACKKYQGGKWVRLKTRDRKYFNISIVEDKAKVKVPIRQNDKRKIFTKF